MAKSKLAHLELNKFKAEVAARLGVDPAYKSSYWGNICFREWEEKGGEIAKKKMASAERGLFGQRLWVSNLID